MEFVSISRVICKSYDLLKVQVLSLVENLSKKNHLQDLLSSLDSVISTKSTEFITGHVIHNPADTYKFQLKITLV